MKEFENWAISTFNDLVRESFDAQEAFDNFDPRTDADLITLEDICAEWRKANRKLVEFVLEYGTDVIAQDD